MYRGGQRRDRWSNGGGDRRAASQDAEQPVPGTTCSHASTERASYHATGATSTQIYQTAKAKSVPVLPLGVRHLNQTAL